MCYFFEFLFTALFSRVLFRRDTKEASIPHRQISKSITSLRTKKIIAQVKILHESLWSKEDILLKT